MLFSENHDYVLGNGIDPGAFHLSVRDTKTNKYVVWGNDDPTKIGLMMAHTFEDLRQLRDLINKVLVDQC